MQAITNTSSAAPGRVQFQLQAARREARQAEQTARALETQAQAAQRSANQEQSRADGLAAQASEAGDRSDTAHRSLASIELGARRGAAAFASDRGTGQLVDFYA